MTKGVVLTNETMQTLNLDAVDFLD